MNYQEININGNSVQATSTGALWWEDQRILTVSDLHLGKSDRVNRLGGPQLPPYEIEETLSRLEGDINNYGAQTVICLGDSFDDLAAASNLNTAHSDWILRLQAGRRWIWIEGNHDPGPVNVCGTHLREFECASVIFRHIAQPAGSAEISGHYHPKFTLNTRGRRITRRCFVYDENRIILPAYGTYTGGLSSKSDDIQKLFSTDANVIVTGQDAFKLPLSTVSQTWR